jgi:uncharacterized protein with ParB-like and HNH nuclease domain
MIKSVNCYPVSQLFDIEAGVVYFIPRYQREYTWGKNHWENLFDDVLENDPGYFLGSIICINQSDHAYPVASHTVPIELSKLAHKRQLLSFQL